MAGEEKVNSGDRWGGWAGRKCSPLPMPLSLPPLSLPFPYLPSLLPLMEGKNNSLDPFPIIDPIILETLEGVSMWKKEMNMNNPKANSGVNNRQAVGR